ncbi:hypothetical protein L1286_01275 [Pseudoalteromonas sp. SMS1]|uniref:hypothetical protein n=1 Tax=Pseudoalteromonas sp. SMS1 TaxID=2908894 RepID=UPI001F4348CD|nr:hypothetical protein [Pseudoalteromonas sp. SMS1]MCF2856090.1 hypothetical protein [Pseudoalteromonas sp. SMS1]
MYFNLVLLRTMQRALSSMLLIVLIFLFNSFSAYASPGAHGPNGEHLNTQPKVDVSSIPTFESATESFELVGLLYDHQLVIYLHDFKSNVPVTNASIELEVENLSASMVYSMQRSAYILNDEAVLSTLIRAGTHEIVLTVLADNRGDLLTASLETVVKPRSDATQRSPHHHEFPWLIAAMCLLVFVAGYMFGRQSKESKS